AGVRGRGRGPGDRYRIGNFPAGRAVSVAGARPRFRTGARPLIEAHLLKMRRRHPISADEESFIRSLVGEVRDVSANATIVGRGDPLRNSILLLDGWGARQKVLPDGDAHISQLHIAGDFVDLHGFTLKRLDHDLVALTGCRLGLVRHERLAEMVERFGYLTQAYWFATNLDAAISREWTV